MTKQIRTLLSVKCQARADEVREDTLNDEEYTVIPCVALVEGVLTPSNAPGPELALASEFGHTPATWDGRPVVLGHPYDADGNPISANSPAVLSEQSFGQIFNTKLDDKKLVTEIWINDARVKALGGDIESTVERLTNGEEDDVVEVSTGLFSINEATQGVYGGEQYQSVWRNVIPDHLAILAEGFIGACSVADGCGAPRVNAADATANGPGKKKGKNMNEGESDEETDEEETTVNQGTGVMNSVRLSANECSCGGEEAEQPAPNALAELDLTPEQQQTFMQRVMNMFGIKANEVELPGMSQAETMRALESAILQTDDMRDGSVIHVMDLQEADDNGRTYVFYYNANRSRLYRREYAANTQTGAVRLGAKEDYAATFNYEVLPEGEPIPLALNQERFNAESDAFVIKANNKELSDQDTKDAVRYALSAGDCGYVYIEAIYHGDDNSGTVIYWDWWTDGMYAVDFNVGAQGAVTIGSEKTPVRRVSQFIPLVIENENPEGDVTANATGQEEPSNEPTTLEQPMNKEEMVKALIDSPDTDFTANDQELLMGIDQNVLQKLAPNVFNEAGKPKGNEGEGEGAEAAAEAKSEAKDNAAAPTAAEEAKPEVKATPTAEEWLNSAPEGIRDVIAQGLSALAGKKDGLVKSLMRTPTNPYSEEQLKAMSQEDLENLAALANVVTFQGAALGGGDAQPVDEDTIVKPPSVLEALKNRDKDAA